MTDFILLMHDDLPPGATVDQTAWAPWFARLIAAGVFRGGSAIGEGRGFRQSLPPAPLSTVTGFVRLGCPDLAHAQACLSGNPVYDAGGTVEIRELPQDE